MQLLLRILINTVLKIIILVFSSTLGKSVTSKNNNLISRIAVVKNSTLKLYSHFHINLWVWIIVFNDEIFILEIVDGFNFASKLQCWERSWFPLQLFFQRLNVIEIYMSVACGVNKLTSLK